MSRYSETEPGTCANCGGIGILRARGLCGSCYQRLRTMPEEFAKFPPLKRPTVEERLSVYKGAPDECWHWGGLINNKGYGAMKIKKASALVHVVAYRIWMGPIPEGLCLDHVCHNRDLECPGGTACLHRRCFNPAHLEPVTKEENSRRGWARIIKCINGHEYTPENTIMGPNGRNCRTCVNAKNRVRCRRDRAAARLAKIQEQDAA